MLNASLNWSSLIGLLLMLWSIPSAAMGAFQIFFVLQRRSDTSPQVIIKTIFLVFQSLGRLIGMPLCGSILFFQGWRLDPILQFGVMLLGIGIVVESFGGKQVEGMESVYKWSNNLKGFTRKSGAKVERMSM